MALTGHISVSEDDVLRPPLAERKELRRQLAALRDRVARAPHESQDPPALRAELATLLFFARTLQTDAISWRNALKDRADESERQRSAERLERQRFAAQREEAVRDRDALQVGIAQTAAQMALQHGGECRRTVPVFTLGEGLSVCSVSVSCPRRGFRCAKRWIVTLSDSHDRVVVRRD